MDYFREIIGSWYALNKRDLPWRETRDPYLIWISEIILQQTRINQGLNYYTRFIGEFPNVSSLASASEDRVLKLWQGLGYYTRARNLHLSAKRIVHEYGGCFPNDYHAIASLKGIGNYTAAAIASIAFNMNYPAVDGNVYRVLARFFGISAPIDTHAAQKTFYNLADEVIKGVANPGTHNQAMMEFGALQCTPKNPNCFNCPLSEKCYAYKNGKISMLPAKQNKTKQRNRYFNYLVLLNKEYSWLKKRTKNDIWKNLFEFPMIESNDKISTEHLFDLPQFKKIIPNRHSADVQNITNWTTHILTHQRIHYRFITIQVTESFDEPENIIKVNTKDIFNFAVPKPIEPCLRNLFGDGH